MIPNKIVPKPTLTEEHVRTSVAFLNRTFRKTAEEMKARTGLTSNVRGSVLYGYQVEFVRLIDSIQRGPIFFAMQHIAEANDLIGKMSLQQKPIPERG